MKKLSRYLVLFLIVACEHSTEVSKDVNWHGSMRGLAESMVEVMPQLISTTRQMTPEDQKKLKMAINDLQAYSASLVSNEMLVPSQDPSLRYVALDFQKELKTLKAKSRTDDIERTRAQLRHLTRYCVACHTRTQSGSSQLIGEMEKNTSHFSDFQKGEFYAAVRQYEKALVFLEKALTDKQWAAQHSKTWNQAAMQLLAITVRVHNNPNLTVEMLSRLFDTQSYPRDLEKAARVWKQDAKAWEREKSGSASLSQISPLLKKAQARDKKLENSGLILNLRALAKLNTYLKEGGKQARNEQDVLYFTGILTKRLGRLSFSGFPNSYFQACLAMDAKSSTGRKCQKSLTN